jgi:nucleoside-diphosphate-sugar epimerase
MTRRLLLTGATGLLGRPLLSILAARGYDVQVLSRRSEVAGASRTLTADLLDTSSRRRALAEAKATHLIHLAWHDSPRDRWHSPENLAWAAATLNLIKEFSEFGGERAVCVGSCAEYDWSNAVLAEDSPLAPRSLYGKAKAATGTLCVASAPDLRLSLAWARVFFCYGPGEPKGRLLGDLLHGLSANQFVPCTDGLQRRDFLHTDDITEALACVLESPLTGAVNIGSGQATEVREIVETIARLMNRSELLQLGKIPRAKDDPPSLSADIARLRTTGFAPKFTLTTGLEACTRAYLSESRPEFT